MSLRMSVKQTSPKTINSGLVTTDSLNALGIGNPVTLDKFITLEYKKMQDLRDQAFGLPF